VSYAFDHVGMLVHDLAEARAALAHLGYARASELFVDERQGIHIQFVWGDDARPRLELVQPARDDSVVSALLVKSGATPYHLCFRAPVLEPAVEALDEEGYRLLREPAAAPAFGGARFCFLYHRQLGLVELVELP
jgi:methylmalonyl-CoA/ethylmalonyl-CoA epimerase